MNMADIAQKALAAHEALAALAQAVRDLPEPRFKFARSVGLLAQLSSWAERNRMGTGFIEAETLSSALEAGLETGCKGRKAELPKPNGKKKDRKTPTLASLNAAGDGSISLTDIAAVLGGVGGESRSAAKVAAARANIAEINRRKRRLASGRQKTRD